MDVLPADPTVPGYYLRADYYDAARRPPARRARARVRAGHA